MMAGCSLASTQGPPRRPSPHAGPCTTSYVDPVLDTVLASGGAIATYAVATHRESGSTGEGYMKIYALPPLIVTTLIFTYSAFRGYRLVDECRKFTIDPGRWSRRAPRS